MSLLKNKQTGGTSADLSYQNWRWRASETIISEKLYSGSHQLEFMRISDTSSTFDGKCNFQFYLQLLIEQQSIKNSALPTLFRKDLGGLAPVVCCDGFGCFGVKDQNMFALGPFMSSVSARNTNYINFAVERHSGWYSNCNSNCTSLQQTTIR